MPNSRKLYSFLKFRIKPRVIGIQGKYPAEYICSADICLLADIPAEEDPPIGWSRGSDPFFNTPHRLLAVLRP